MAPPARTGIVHYAWPEGLAIVVDGPARRTASIFGPRGWLIGDPAAVLADGPPEGAEAAALDLPLWLVEQLPSLELSTSGLHTDFLRVPRLVERLRTEGADAAVFVLGRIPAAVVIAGGQAVVVEPAAPEGLPVESALAAAAGWVVVLSGFVKIPAAEGLKPPVQESRPVEERFLVSPAAAQSLPPEVAAELTALAGDGVREVVALLDGSRTVEEIAQTTGLQTEQVSAVVKALVLHKLAFRYVSRARRPTGVKTPG